MAAVPIALRLCYLQTFRHDELYAKEAHIVTSSVTEVKTRGRILDHEGDPLAESLRTYSCAVLKHDVDRPTELLGTLSEALGMPRPELDAKWREARNFFYVKRKLSPAEYERLNNMLQSKKLRGVSIETDYTRFYPGGDMARDLVGTVDYDNAGSSGLELLYEDILGGKLERGKAIKDKYGDVIYTTGSESEVGASDVYLTLDNKIQFFVESALDDAIKQTRASGGFAIVEDPATGGILAAASSPRKSGQSMPFQWTYEPGSTFKLVTLSAAFEKGKIKTTDTMDCEASGKWQFNSKVVINDDEPLGVLSVPDVFAHSSNICSAKIALKLGLEDFYSFIRDYGFGTKTVLGYPGESQGLLRPPEKWQPIDLAVTGFGHGIAITGIQLIDAYSAIANGGVLMEPRLVERITDPAGSTIYQSKPHQLRRVVSPETVKIMNSLLRRVVEIGTGVKAQIPGYTVAGKTGTAQKIDEHGKYSKSEHVASFCGFVPASKPRFTILVVIDKPTTTAYGGEAAAPAFAEIAKRLLSAYAIAPDAPGTLNKLILPGDKVPTPVAPPPPNAPKAAAKKPAAAVKKPVLNKAPQDAGAQNPTPQNAPQPQPSPAAPQGEAKD
jgi:cell division protein FtsI (penicillin-binding protein 3)